MGELGKIFVNGLNIKRSARMYFNEKIVFQRECQITFFITSQLRKYFSDDLFKSSPSTFGILITLRVLELDLEKNNSF